MEKVCFKCGRKKSLDDFYAHPKMKDGHLGKCKECTKNDVHDIWFRDAETHRQNERDRYQRRKLNKTYTTNLLKGNNAWRKQKGRAKAHNQIHRKLKNPGVCSLCGSTRAVGGHHMDYSKPLEVVWCCSVCHRKFRKMSV